MTILQRIWLWLTRRPKENEYSDMLGRMEHKLKLASDKHNDLRCYTDTLECIVARLTHEYPTVVECLTNHERRVLTAAKAARDKDPTWEPGYGRKTFKLPEGEG